MDEKQNWIGALLSRRQVVPRWHSPDYALETGERDSARCSVAPKALPVHWLRKLGEEARQKQVHADVELAEVQFLHASASMSRDDLPDKLRALWHRASTHPEGRPPERPTNQEGDWIALEKRNVAKLRASLARHPRQALMWSELARSHIVLGEDEKARRAMGCAVQLAGRSAYVRRSAARMHLHLEDVSGALRAVRQHPNFVGDPRMPSAELAITSRAGLPLSQVKRGLKMLDDGNFRTAHLSELAAALATIEMEAGKHKKSRALFARSLQAPSENTLAQVQWAAERDDTIMVPEAAWSVPKSFEAHALAARLTGDWDEVLTCCEQWLEEEPYATRPAVLGSFATYTKAQAFRAERLATRALSASQQSVSLRNNRAVARAYLGDIEGALKDVRSSLGCHVRHVPYLLATLGLIGYRSGDLELGSLGYSAAVSHFVGERDASSAALAGLFWLRELARTGDPAVAKDLEWMKRDLQRLTGNRPEPEITSMIESLEHELAQASLALCPGEERIAAEARDLFYRFNPPASIGDWRQRLFER
jgi:tetratricopeptide (TPR) repeat protein